MNIFMCFIYCQIKGLYVFLSSSHMCLVVKLIMYNFIVK